MSTSCWYGPSIAWRARPSTSSKCSIKFNHLGIEFISYRENIDTSGPLGRALMTIIGAIAELERNLIIERVRVGMRRARLDGRHIGRKPLDLDRVAIHRDRAAGHSLGELAKLHRISRANRRSASSSFPFRTHCWNLRWQVWNGGYFSGSSRHCAPVPNPHNTPCSTARVSCHGRPRLSARRCGRSTGSTTSHCSSVSSQRPRIGTFGDLQSIPRMPPTRTATIYETGSRQLS
jgi:hypothetical protein